MGRRHGGIGGEGLVREGEQASLTYVLYYLLIYSGPFLGIKYFSVWIQICDIFFQNHYRVNFSFNHMDVTKPSFSLPINNYSKYQVKLTY